MTAKVITRVVFLLVALLTFGFAGPATAGEMPTPEMTISADPNTVAIGGTVEVTFTLCPGEALIGTEAEWWIMAKAPSGKRYYLSGGTWYEDPRAYSLANLADFSKTFTSLAFDEGGAWLLYFALDGDKDGALAGDALAATTTVTVTGGGGGGGGCGACNEPQPGIVVSNANPDQNDTILLTLSMDSGSYAGQDAEWWLVAYSPGGCVYYYNGTTWTTTRTYYSRSALHDVSGVTVVSPTLGWLGSWTFSFGVDGVHNNQIDDAWYASCVITVGGGGGGGGGGGTLPQWRVNVTDYRLALGETVNLDLNLYSGSYAGVQAELWLVAISPTGQKAYYNGSAWVTTVTPYLTGALTDLDQLVASFPLTEHGTYSFWFGGDGNLNGAIDLPEHMDVDRTHVSEIPQAFIKANGQTGSLIVSPGTTVELSIALDPGSYGGLNADWWVVGVTPSAMTFTFNSESHIWTRGYKTYRQAPLAEVNWSPVTSVTLTETGTYHFYFGVDEPNNYVDSPAYQEVVVYVQ